jgi:flagellar motor switch protein FliN/FliY
LANDDPPSATALSSDVADALPAKERSPFESFGPSAGEAGFGAALQEADGAPTDIAPLDLVLDIPVRLSVELGRTEIPIREIVTLGRGSVIELDGIPGAPLDVSVNGVLIGRGEVVVINEERLGLRFIEVASQAERIKRLR